MACLDDLVQGKLWAATDPNRVASKRAKDEADLIRLCESHSQVLNLIPPASFLKSTQSDLVRSLSDLACKCDGVIVFMGQTT